MFCEPRSLCCSVRSSTSGSQPQRRVLSARALGVGGSGAGGSRVSLTFWAASTRHLRRSKCSCGHCPGEEPPERERLPRGASGWEQLGALLTGQAKAHAARCPHPQAQRRRGVVSGACLLPGCSPGSSISRSPITCPTAFSTATVTVACAPAPQRARPCAQHGGRPPCSVRGDSPGPVCHPVCRWRGSHRRGPAVSIHATSFPDFKPHCPRRCLPL